MSPPKSSSSADEVSLPMTAADGSPLAAANLSANIAKLRLWPIWLAAFGVALALYAATLAPDVLMMDSGEYHWSTWMFPHNDLPQGPQNLVRMHFNYLMAAKVFAFLVPFGSWFLRINLFSAVAGAVTAGNVSVLTYSLTRSRAATMLAFLALVLGQTFWEYAVIAEVLTLQAATLTAEILLLYLWTTSGRVSWLMLLWLVNGFAAGAHVQNGLASPVYLAITLIAFWQGRIGLWQGLTCAAVWLVGFSPYLMFCIHQMAAAGGWKASLVSATAGGYASRMWQVDPRMWWIWLKGLLFIGLNYPTGLALLCIPGLAALYKNPVGGAFKWGLLGAAGVNLLFAMTYNVPDQQSFFVPAYGAMAVLIGLGANLLLRDRLAWVGAFILAVQVVPVYAVLPRLLQEPRIRKRLPISAPSQPVAYRDPYEFYLIPWKTARHNERRYIEEALAALPEDGIFLCGSTIREGMRAVQLVESRHMQLRLDPPTQVLADDLQRRADQASRWRQPIFLSEPRGPGIPDAFSRYCRLIRRGLVWEVLPPEDPDGFLRDLQSWEAPLPR